MSFKTFAQTSNLSIRWPSHVFAELVAGQSRECNAVQSFAAAEGTLLAQVILAVYRLKIWLQRRPGRCGFWVFRWLEHRSVDQTCLIPVFPFDCSANSFEWTKSRTSTMAQLPGNQSETLMNKCPIKMCSTKSYWITLFFLYATDWLECAEVIWRLCYGLLKELLLLGRAWPGRGMGFAAKSLLFLGSLRLAVSLAPGDCAFVAWRNDRELRTQKVSLNKGSRHFQRISTCTAEQHVIIYNCLQ